MTFVTLIGVIAMANDRYITNGETKIGVFHFPDRKKPLLGILKGNCVEVYGSFRNEETAIAFMNKLAAFMGIGKEDDDGK